MNKHCQFVQPQKPEIGHLATEILKTLQGGTNGSEMLSATLDYFWRSFRSVEVKGLITPSQSIQTGRGNCFSLCCLVASALRRLGVPEHSVGVFIGCPKSHPELVHAFVLAPGKEPGHVSVIDPELMRAMDLPLQTFWAKYRVYVIFNDAIEIMNNNTQHIWLTSLVENSPAIQPATTGATETTVAQGGQTQKTAIQWIAYGAVDQTCEDILGQLRNGGNGKSGLEVLETLEASTRAKIVVVPASVTAKLIQIANRAAQAYFEVISDRVADLSALATCFHLGTKDLKWLDVAHMVVAGLLVDVGVRRELLNTGTIHEQPDDFWIWGFENGTGAANAFGVRVRETSPNDATFYELWHCKTKRTHVLKLDRPDIRLLRFLSEQPQTCAGELSLEDQRRALKLAFYGLSTRKNGTHRANIPVLAGTGAALVSREITRVSQSLMARAVSPAIREADVIYSSEFSGSPPDIFRHAVVRLLMEHAMDRLVAAEVVPPFPPQADYSWGCWLSWTRP